MADSKTVAVAGATGRAGRFVVQELLKRQYKVRALMVPPFDSPETSGLTDVEFAVCDLSNVTSIGKAIRGADYLISALGSKKPFSNTENDKIDNMGNQNLASAAKAEGLKQIVVISSIGVGDSYYAVSCIFRLPMRRVFKAKGKSEAFIRSCGMDYTIVRPGGYTDKELADDAVVFGEGGKITGKVMRSQIARVCVDAIENPAMKNRTLEVVARAGIKEGREEYIITP